MRWEIREDGRDCEGGKRGGGRQNTRGVGWLGRDGAQEDSPTTRPIGASLDKVSDGWPCVETTLAATVTASQPARAAQHITLLRVACFGCCAR